MADEHDPVIYTKRLDLIPLSPAFLEASLRGDRPAAEAIIGLTIPDEWFDERRRIAVRLEQLRRDPGLQPWLSRAVALRDSGVMAGQIGFHTYPAPPYLTEIAPGGIEFGYTVFSPFRRQEIALEASRALMSWAAYEHGVTHFVLSISPNNIPSTRLAESLGFIKVGSQEDETDGPEDIYLLVKHLLSTSNAGGA